MWQHWQRIIKEEAEKYGYGQKEEVHVSEATSISLPFSFIRQQQWEEMRSKYKPGTPVSITLKNGKTVPGILIRIDKYDKGFTMQGHLLRVKTAHGNVKIEDVEIKSVQWNDDPKTRIGEETEIEEAKAPRFPKGLLLSTKEEVEEAYAPLDTKGIVGAFTEATKKKRFEYRNSTDSWGKSHGFPHEVCVSSPGGGLTQWRSANVKGTVCYIVVDEGEEGKPVTEKWVIRNHVKYVKAESVEEVQKEEEEQLDELTGGEVMMYTMASFVALYPTMPPMLIARFLASKAADKFKDLIAKVKSNNRISPSEKDTLKSAIKGTKAESVEEVQKEEVSEGVRMMAGVEKMLKDEGHPTMVGSLRNTKKSLEGKPTGSVMVLTKEKSPESMEIKIYEPSDFASMTKGLTKKAEAKVGSKGSWSGGEVTVIAIKEEVEINERFTQQNAQMIKQQLGGGKFVAMTGAKNFLFHSKDSYLSFKIGGGAKNGINYIKIIYNQGKDDYTMEFYTIRGMNPATMKHRVEGVYADQLREIFEKHTGFYTSLGTMGSRKESVEVNEAKFSTNDLLDSIESAYKKGGLKGVIQGGKKFGLIDRTTVDELLDSAKSMFGADLKKAATEIKGFLKPQDYAKYKTKMESVEESDNWKQIYESKADEAANLANEIRKVAKNNGVSITVESNTSVSFSKDFTKGNMDEFFAAYRDCDQVRRMVKFKSRGNEWGCGSSGFGIGAQECVKSGKVRLSKSGDGASYLLKALSKRF